VKDNPAGKSAFLAKLTSTTVVAGLKMIGLKLEGGPFLFW